MDFGRMCVCVWCGDVFKALVYVISVVFSMLLESFSSRRLGLDALGNELS